MQVIKVRRFAGSMHAEWRAFRPLYESVLFAVVWAYLAGVGVMIVRSENFGWRCVFIGYVAGCVGAVAYYLLEVRRFVRR
jgi:hypothetical protein